MRSPVRSRSGPPAFARSAGYGSAASYEATQPSTAWTRRRRRLSRRSFSEGGLHVKYVYILQSLADPDHFYSGITDDLKARLSAHNSGAVTHTSKYRPCRIKSYVAFTDKARALTFEKYLKSGSGRAFVKTHL